MIDRELLGVRPRALGVWIPEIRLQLEQRCPVDPEMSAEAVDDPVTSLVDAAGVVVQNDEGQVVEILLLPP